MFYTMYGRFRIKSGKNGIWAFAGADVPAIVMAAMCAAAGR